MPHVAGQYYHVYNRGCNRENIFLDDENYQYLLGLADRFLPGADVSVIAYCLMPNHYHLLLRANADGSIGRFVQRLFNSYTQAFNKQHERSGTLFEGRAKSIYVDEESYLLDLFKYIHLNPVVARLVKHPEDWKYSNYPEWIGKRDRMLVDHEFIQTYFTKPSEYARFIEASVDEAITRKLEKYDTGED